MVSMKSKKERSDFPIEKKLATIEWNLELLKASIVTTHTPLRTLKSMVETEVLPSTRNLVSKLIDPTIRKTKDKLTQIICP